MKLEVQPSGGAHGAANRAWPRRTGTRRRTCRVDGVTSSPGIGPMGVLQFALPAPTLPARTLTALHERQSGHHRHQHLGADRD
ncbi:MAG: hypothetical protein M3Q40_10700 [Pseudomonadota bacterium]|nr:hypothetical protein [Pseudomonadota bacterium]